MTHQNLLEVENLQPHQYHATLPRETIHTLIGEPTRKGIIPETMDLNPIRTDITTTDVH